MKQTMTLRRSLLIGFTGSDLGLSKVDVCIIGGGLAGLSLAYYLGLEGVRNAVIIEARERVGGLLRTATINGYTFDSGGSHIIFSKDLRLLNEVNNLIDTALVGHRRNSKICYKGIYVKYPFENGLSALPPYERYECLKGIVQAYISRITGRYGEPRNFLEWLRQVFGDGIAEKYLIPYNRKLWKVDLREISIDWVGGRVPNPPLDEVLKAAVGVEVEGYRHQLYFTYPATGGIESLAKSLMRRVKELGVKVVTGDEVIEVGEFGGGVEVLTREGMVIRCRRAVLTTPLRRASRMLKPLLGNDALLLRKLRSVPLAVVGIGFKGMPLPPYHWIYYPGDDVIFHRLGLLSNYSPANSPPGAASLIAEVSLRRGEGVKGLERRVIEDLEYIGMLKESMIEAVGIWLWDDAYVIYDRVRSEVVSKVGKSLKEKGVFIHGRFGCWEYLNMDAIILRSRRLAEELAVELRKPS